MKTNRIIATLALSALASALTGCVLTSVYPFYSEQNLSFEPALLRGWKQTDNADAHWKFERAGTNGYNVTLHSKAGTSVLRGYTFKLEEQMFLDLTTTDWKEKIEPEPVPSHWLVRIEQLTPTLKLSMIDYEWLKKLVAKDHKAVRHIAIQYGEKPEHSRIVLTADPAELQQFVLKHLRTKKAWEPGVELIPDAGDPSLRSWLATARVMTTKCTTRSVQLLATGLLLLCTGCETIEKYSLTHRLWHSGDWQQFSEPAPNPNLALFEATNRSDLLIQYDALSESSSTPRRRAYFLNPNERRIVTGKKPKWVKPSATAGMNPIPVLATPSVATNPPPQMPAYAVPSKGGRAFTLHGLTKSETTFDLPVYTESSGTPMRVLLTPLAIAGDTVLVTAASAAVGFMLWIHCGAPTH